ncbi:MAG: L,D-transpeptidase family protein [Lachnospiraceae bacterium]|nr:L,D-transpeptidase family protein [Lachnospiraceae bacterium]
MAKSCKRFLFLLLLMVLLVLVGYLGLGILYSGHFTRGTWINGIYCTGKTVEEVNLLLIEQTQIPNFVIIDDNDKTYEISLEEVSCVIDYTSQLYRVMYSQNPFRWIGNDTNDRKLSIEPHILFDEKMLFQAVRKSFPFVVASLKEHDLKIYKDENGYQLYNGMEHVLNEEKTCQLVLQKLEERIYSLHLGEAQCYTDLPLTVDMAETLLLYEQVTDFQQCNIVYDMEEEMIALTPAIVAEWILVNENGEFVLDAWGHLMLRDGAIEEFVNWLADEYDSVGKARTFTATNGKEVVVEGGIYGNEINRKKEIAYLKEAFLSKADEIRIPTYSQKALHRGKNDIGDTYIEIDMTDQKMYYYQDGELLIETDVVTGNMKRKDATPSGVNYVYAKQRNRTLKGEDYASFVKYWMPVKGSIGIHDASWRKNFGGDIYLTKGSHGCINTPSEVMKELYNLVEKGTPVVMFYS